MEFEGIRNIIEEFYDIPVLDIEKVKNVYKIYSENKIYCLKCVRYDFKHFYFILCAMKHLQNNGFKTVPEIIRNNRNEDYVALEKGFGYLNEWLNVREANYDNPLDVAIASKKLAELHNASKGFKVDRNTMNPRVGWLNWIESFKNKRDEIISFKKYIEEKDVRTEFDKLFIENIAEEVERAERAISNLEKSDYFKVMRRDMLKGEFCHHDYAHHNVLINDKGEVNIIDFDYCILDSHLHDLASLLMRRMKDGNWDMYNAKFILDCYGKILEVEKKDIPIMAAFLEFPQAYWQVGLQYYVEHQPWSEENFLKRLNRVLSDREDRQEFIDEFSKGELL